MVKYALRAFFAVVVIAMAGFIVAQRNCEMKLRKGIQSLQLERGQLRDFVAENARISNLLAQIARLKEKSEVPSSELLRLRGQVTRLRQEHYEAESLRKENERLRLENEELGDPYPTLNDMYVMGGWDKIWLPKIEQNTTKDEALAQLRRVGANIVIENDNYINAVVTPRLAGITGGNLAPIRLELYFEGGKLTQRKDL